MSQSTPPYFYKAPKESPITLVRNQNNFKVLAPMHSLKNEGLNIGDSSPIIVSLNLYFNLKVNSHYQSEISTNSNTRNEKLVSDLTLTKSYLSENTNDRVRNLEFMSKKLTAFRNINSLVYYSYVN